jgi:glycine/D-amino acid oxidase-like deaminating enzyme
MNVIIVGAGLFGSMAATLARYAGHAVVVIDSKKTLAASKCAACLMKRSWMAALSPEQINIGYRVLEQLYGVQQIPFNNGTLMLDWVDPLGILLEPDLTQEVAAVGNGAVAFQDLTGLEGTVLVAAGAYSRELVKMPEVRGLVGASLHLPGRIRPQLKLYAPYRQAIAFNIGSNQVWVGDGCAILEKNWRPKLRTDLLCQRAWEYFKLKSAGNFQLRAGARPYVEGYKAGYFERVFPRTWVVTGGAKNGTILAAYYAQKFVEAIS